MPGIDRTGPSGNGPMTGRRMGLCGKNTNIPNSRSGLGYKRRRGIGNGLGGNHGNMSPDRAYDIPQKSIIENEINILKEQIASLEDRLKNLDDKSDE